MKFSDVCPVPYWILVEDNNYDDDIKRVNESFLQLNLIYIYIYIYIFDLFYCSLLQQIFQQYKKSEKLGHFPQKHVFRLLMAVPKNRKHYVKGH